MSTLYIAVGKYNCLGVVCKIERCVCLFDIDLVDIDYARHKNDLLYYLTMMVK